MFRLGCGVVFLVTSGIFNRQAPPKRILWRGDRSGMLRAVGVGGEASQSENVWKDDSASALAQALARHDTAWDLLQIEAESDSKGDKSRTQLAGELAGEVVQSERRARAANLMVDSALDRLRPFTVPAEYIDIPPLRGSDEALRNFLGADSVLVDNFMSGSESLSGAGRAFWQAEVYLRRLHEVAGESSVEETAEAAKNTVEEQPLEQLQSLRGSILLARQNFVTAARFGYFLRRGSRRLALEAQFGSLSEDSTEAEKEVNELEDFLQKLRQKSMEFGLGPRVPESKPRRLENYLSKLSPEEAVELVRPASEEANEAIERRASALFGSELHLLREMEASPANVPQLALSAQGRKLLSLEAAAFGAALFEAEEVAARRYGLTLTRYGARRSPFSV